jgi:hypothetical protein
LIGETVLPVPWPTLKACMSKVSAVAKSSAAFGVLGAWLGGISSYVFEYWGSHGGMWSALLDAQTRPMAWPAVIGNVQMAIMTGYPAALLAGLLLSAVGLMLRGQLVRHGLLVWPLLGGSAGALAAFALFGASYGMGHPVASGLSGGAISALLLSRWLRAWLCPVHHGEPPPMAAETAP